MPLFTAKETGSTVAKGLNGVVGMRCVYCEFQISPGNEAYTISGAIAHWQCADFNDWWERRIRRQKEAQALLPEGIEQQIIETWENELEQSPVTQ